MSTLLTEPLMVALPLNHPLCEKEEIHIADLRNIEAIGFDMTSLSAEEKQ